MAGGLPVQTYIVVLDLDPSQSAQGSAVVAADHGIIADRTFQAVLAGFTAEMTAQEAAEVAGHPLVAFVEEDQVWSISHLQTPVPSWGVDRLDQRNLPLDDRYVHPNEAESIHFYGLDTGIRSSHDDFGGRIGTGHTVILDGLGTEDCNGHGTHTASTAGGEEHGVAKGMTLHPVRVMDCSGSGTQADVIAGMDWVVANAEFPSVANISLSGPASAAADLALSNMVAAGIFVSVAAGNSNANACLESPGRVPEAFTVAATTPSDARSTFSNFGSCVDIFAPGSDIVGAWYTSNTASSTISGTSSAAAHAAGVAALLLEIDPSWTPAEVASLMTAAAVPNLVSGKGWGSPNLLLHIGPLNGPPNEPPVADWTYQCDANITCTFDGTSSSDPDGTIVTYEWIDAGGFLARTGPTVTHTFPSPSTLTLTLRVTDDLSLKGTLTRTVTIGPNEGDGPPPPVNEPPVADWTYQCDAFMNCSFDGTSSNDPDGTIVLYEWLDVGGYVVRTGPTVTHTFPSPRALTLTLRVTDDDGATGTHTRTVAIGPDEGDGSPPPPNQPPVADWTYQCDANVVCTFDGSTSFDPDGTIVSYEWRVGANVVGSGPIMTRGVAAQTVTLSLIVVDDGGATARLDRTVVLGPNEGDP